jgi:hypothetical protein
VTFHGGVAVREDIREKIKDEYDRWRLVKLFCMINISIENHGVAGMVSMG